MDGFPEFLDVLKEGKHAEGNLLGLLNVLIGRRIETADGQVISAGLTWRALAGWLKKARWDKDAVRELRLEPKDLPPRDREKFWYAAIAQAQVSSARAAEAGDRFAEVLRRLAAIRAMREDVADGVWNECLRTVDESVLRHSQFRPGETSYLDFVSDYVG